MTGLIYVVIIALWAAVLIPMWLRRHDQVSEMRSTAKFSSAMRSLGGVDQRLQVRDATEATRVRRPSAAARASRRRTTILLLLTGTLVATMALAMAGMMPMPVAMGMAVLVLAFELATALTASARVQSASAVREFRELRSEETVVAAVQVDEWEDEGWEPVRATLPTYVTAPRASAMPRRIDLDTPGEWTGTAMVEAANSMRTRRAPRPDYDEIFGPVGDGESTAEIPAVREDRGRRRAAGE